MKKIIFVLLICTAGKAFSSKITDAYAALHIYDYFKAKSLFFSVISKNPSHASYGLAIIFNRTDNPFSNIDSAAKYIAISKLTYKDTATYSSYHISNETINELAASIAKKGFEKYTSDGIEKNLIYFLEHYYFADENLLNKAYLCRDEIQLKYYLSFKSSDSANYFPVRFPESNLTTTAIEAGFNFQYREKVNESSLQQLKYFLKVYPKNPNISKAELKLFELTKQSHNADSLYSYIKNYSTVLTKEDAWKTLYSLSVKDYSKQELTAFVSKYPEYPYNESVLKEIVLSQQILIPLKNANDVYGFIDTLGNWIIKPVFDDAMLFSEGFSAVCKSDSCFFIDKEGSRPSGFYYEEAENYKNGLAIVKKENAYYLINRAGQMISKGYQDINAASENLYVCKLNNLYGAINAKGDIVIPFMYTKLGNFKNGYAYYLSTQYGLVDIRNNALEARWSWISDVDTNSLAIVKKENRFGLMNVSEQIVLQPQFDYIAPCANGIYLVVKNNLYGFYNAIDKCYVTAIAYDYDQGLETDYYTNGKVFKLIGDDQVALVDANGRYSINFGTYTNFFFAKNDIIRIQKNNKYGFVDRKLKPLTAIEFDKATDFESNVAVVTKGSNASLIDKSGKIVFTIKGGEIDRYAEGLYLVKQNNLVGLINSTGKQILNSEFQSIEQLPYGLLKVAKSDGLYLFNTHTTTLKKI